MGHFESEAWVKLHRNNQLDGKGGLSQKSLLYIHRVLCEAIEHAVKKNLIPRNIVKDVTNKPRPKKFKNDIYNNVELAELLTFVKDTYMEAAIALGGVYGLRRGEVLGLRWSDVDFDNNIISVSQQLVPVNNTMQFDATKSEESNRILPITQEIKEILQRRKAFQEHQITLLRGAYQDNNMVVCNDDGTLIDPRNFSKRFASLLKKHCMKHIQFHDLSYPNLNKIQTFLV